MNFILCGLPCSGKTTCGKKLANNINCKFIDTDHLIEDAYAVQTGQHFTCRQICIKEGERKFRELEKQQISSLSISEKAIISTGGGSIIDPENVKTLKQFGQIIYLKTPLDILWHRIYQRGLPSYLDPKNPEKSFYESATIRIPLFEKAADHIIDTTQLSEHDLIQVLTDFTLFTKHF